MPECRNILMNKKPKKLKENDDTKNLTSYFKLFHCASTDELVVVTLEQNLLFYHLESLKLSKQVNILMLRLIKSLVSKVSKVWFLLSCLMREKLSFCCYF